MRKKRNSSRGDIIIDLTSLLDVMFIILLVVLCGQSTITDNLSEMQANAESARVQAEAEYKLYDDQLKIADSLNQYVWAVSIAVPYDEAEITKRQILFLKEGEKIETIDLVGNDVTSSISAFKESLINYIQKNNGKPVILSLNDDDSYILYRDEVMVNEVFKELSNMYSNVYIKGCIGEETK